MHGFLILNKPAGVTSAHAVAIVKRKLRELGLKHLKIGHGGTLDPLATGVLPLAIGEATKTISYVLTGDKAYDFTVRWGIATDTDDMEGQEIATSPVRPTATQIAAALPAFTGPIMQQPPAFSALKIDGARAYDLARAGEVVELASRPVDIHELELTDQPDADHASFTVSCGKGTYVRALGRDLALKLGTVGHISELIRIKAGAFGMDQAISLETIAEISDTDGLQGVLLPLTTVLADIPALAVTSGEAGKIRHGQSLPHIMVRSFANGATVLVTENGQPVALCEMREPMTLAPLRVFNL